eukprot:1160551-Pelagomonas_calceolata.AAC.5
MHHSFKTGFVGLQRRAVLQAAAVAVAPVRVCPQVPLYLEAAVAFVPVCARVALFGPDSGPLGGKEGLQNVIKRSLLPQKLPHVGENCQRRRQLNDESDSNWAFPKMNCAACTYGSASAADAHHVLRFLGISHIINATEVTEADKAWTQTQEEN